MFFVIILLVVALLVFLFLDDNLVSVTEETLVVDAAIMGAAENESETELREADNEL